MDDDGRVETVVITSSSVNHGNPIGGELIVRQPGRRSESRRRHMNPWKLQVVDVDGDRKLEVVVGVWKKSPKDPVMAKRVFVYSWDGQRLVPKWLSSRLARRFDDFALADVDKDGWAELFALEKMPGGKHRVSEYRWRSFGFDWVSSTKSISGATSLRSAAGGIEVLRERHKPLALGQIGKQEDKQ